MTLTLDQALQKGIEAHKAGKVKEADRFYTAILKANPKHPDANHNIGVLALGAGKFEEALPFFKTAIETNPNMAQYWLSYIDALVKLDRITDAKAVLDRVKRLGLKGDGFDQLESKLNPVNSTVINVQEPPKDHLQDLINLYTQGQCNKALTQASQSLKQFPNSLGLYNIFGVINQSLGKLDDAIEAFSRALSIKPDYAEAYNNMAYALQEQGKLEDAIEAYNKALSIKPDYAEAYYNMGIALKEQGKLEEAIKAYIKATSLMPKNAEAHNNMGIALKEQGKLEEAIKAYIKATLLKPDYSEAFYNLGITLKDHGKLEEAIVAYHDAILIKPDYAEAFYNLGNALKEQDRLDEAVVAYHKAISLKLDSADVYNNLGNAFQVQGKLEEAIYSYNKALSIKPDYAEVYNNMGNALKDDGKLEKAIVAYNKAIPLKPESVEAFYNLGITLQEQGKLDEAIQAYNKALTIKPDLAEVYYNMGKALRDQGKLEKSVSNFQKAFTIRSGIVPTGDDALAPATVGLFFELTNKCNFHCVFCPSDSQKRNLGSMNFELVKKLYTEASEKNLASVVNLHLMGEPTLHPKLIEILEFGASKNIKTDLVTNGSTLVAKIIPKIFDSLYGRIIASHMTPTKDTYHFRGKVGLSWERYIGNLRLLVREYIKRISQGNICKNVIDIRVMSTMNTAANCTVTETIKEARNILKEWGDFVASIEDDLGMDRFERSDYKAPDFLQGDWGASLSYPLQKGITLTFWRAFTFANTRVSDEFDLDDNTETAYCSHPFTDVGVLWNGDVTLCCLDHDGELSVGNINGSSLEAIVQNDSAKKLRASMLGRCSLPTVCQTCQAKPIRRQNSYEEYTAKA